MAVALFGGSFLSASLQVLFDRLASRDFINLFRGKKRTEILLKKLNRTLVTLKPVLDDAEYKQLTNPAVKEWLDMLKDAIYHADDLVDEIATRATLSKLDSEDNEFKRLTAPVSDLVSYSVLTLFDEDIASKIQVIIDGLEDFVKDKDVLGLREVVGQNPSPRWPTTSLVDQDSVCGRHDDKDKIIQMVLSPDDPNGHPVSVIPIVGMGGVGKTTLAQFVYNDPQVDAHNFDMKAWVCVSEEFDILTITKKILEAIPDTCNTDDLNLLQVKLKNRLTGTKFLLVLDDVWNKNYGDWDRLRSVLTGGAHGSKIILTTRSRDVASIMQTVPIHHLEELSDEECWSIFLKHAFEIGNLGVLPNLETIGRKIVAKCKGLPLAAKTLGGLLRSKLEVKEWEDVLESEIWDLPNDESNILPALLLSYHHLPSDLKRCFAYCAIFPKDFEFKKEMLVRLWMAEGFVQRPKNKRRIEKIADGYFRELIARSLIQQSSDNEFIMHDLINDLAMFVSGEFHFRFGDNWRTNIARVRHFSLLSYNGFREVKVINEARCLRTFLSLQPDHIYNSSKMILGDLFSAQRYLRVISLRGFDIVELPNSIGDLIHLRYLDLSGTKIKCLPESISRLCNLQTLLLRGCRELTELPRHTWKLNCLRHLDINETNLREMPEQIGRLESLQGLAKFIVGKLMGTRITELKELHDLHGSLSILNLQNVCNGVDASKANLKHKMHLEVVNLEWSGDLIPDDSQIARDVLEKLQPHTNLKNLTIRNYGGTRFPDWIGDRSFSNIQSLCLDGCTYSLLLPSLGQLPYLKDLTVKGMNGVMTIGSEFYGAESTIKPFQSLERLRFEDMAEWEEWCTLGAGEFCHLQELRIINCPKMIRGSPKHLPSLKVLEISRCRRLVIENLLELDDHAQMPTLSDHLCSLQELVIKNILDLEILLPKMCRLTNFEILHLHNCPSLKYLCSKRKELKRVISTLKKLYIIECPKFRLPLYKDEEYHHKSLQQLWISDCDSLKSIPFSLFPKLQTLHLSECRNFESLSVIDKGLQNLTSLQDLRISYCPKMECFPEGGLPAPNLTVIEIRGCEKLKLLPEKMCTLLPSLKSLQIADCPEIESFPEGGLPHSLSDLWVSRCKKLMGNRREWGLQRLPSLKHLLIWGESEEEEEEEEEKLLVDEYSSSSSFPEDECLFPATLTSLSIWNRPNMKTLNPNGMRQLHSLQRLDIQNCPKLHCLPDEGLPTTSLSLLFIIDCPMVKERCKRGIGQDWLKIAHIPHVYINDEKV